MNQPHLHPTAFHLAAAAAVVVAVALAFSAILGHAHLAQPMTAAEAQAALDVLAVPAQAALGE